MSKWKERKTRDNIEKYKKTSFHIHENGDVYIKTPNHIHVSHHIDIS